jgi:hypothetical protein
MAGGAGTVVDGTMTGPILSTVTTIVITPVGGTVKTPSAAGIGGRCRSIAV